MSNWKKSRLRVSKQKPFHIKNLEFIKQITAASFVGFIKEKEIYYLRFVKNNKETLYKLHGEPSDVTQDRYKELLDLIIYGENNKNIIENDGVQDIVQ